MQLTDPISPMLPEIGARATRSRTITETEVVLYGGLTGDQNPVHMNAEYAATTPFGQRIAHGLLTAGLISAILGNQLPGLGTIYLSQTLEFKAPVFIGDTITAEVEVVAVRTERRIVTLRTECRNQQGMCVLTGTAVVKVQAP